MILPDPHWEAFCKRGLYSIENQRMSVEHCMGPDGVVRGHYSDFQLDPTLPEKSALYPSHDHTYDRSDDSQMVVDARFINDMKSILSEDEFWMVIAHLHSVGVEKGKINRDGHKRLPSAWKLGRNY